jgi:hypothetical protein
MTTDDAKLAAAIRHAVNYHSLDARLNMPGFEIAALITPEVSKHLAGKTDVQVIEAMTPEERARIGQE